MSLLDDTGLLDTLMPEVAALKGVEQPPKFHPEGDVFTHTMLLIRQLKNADTILAFACLLHDIGKPATFKKTDRIRFNGHDRVGARLTERILRRFRFSNEEARKISYCVDNHMRIMNAMRMRESTLKRMFLKDTFEMELLLHKYDCIASHADLKIYQFLRKRYTAFKKKPQLPRPLLNGHELMAMGLKEGPSIGKIHKKMVDMQFEGKLSSKEKAKRWVREKFLKRC
jgi:poly(A) polymerase